jgi:hypothetical protein
VARCIIASRHTRLATPACETLRPHLAVIVLNDALREQQLDRLAEEDC